MITRGMVRVFTNGQCHALAFAIQELTGWPLYAVRFEDEDPDTCDPGHVLVKSPKGFFDITGVTDEEQLAYAFFSPVNSIFSVTREEVENFYSYVKSKMEEARAAAQVVLDQYFPSKRLINKPEKARAAYA